MAMINYADKVALYENSNIADINKVKADDMNELKKAFNNQVAFGWYQTGLSPTFTYVSWDSSVCTGVVNSNLDLTPYLSVGMKVKFTQNSAIKYAFITAITSTQLTLFLGTDYSLNNSAISNTYYSMLKAPFGFPTSEESWAVTLTYSSNAYGTPSNDTWWNPGNLSIDVPIGVWKIRETIPIRVYFTLSSTGYFVGIFSLGTTTSVGDIAKSKLGFNSDFPYSGVWASTQTLFKEFTYTASAKIKLYLNHKIITNGTIGASNGFNGNDFPIYVALICAYL